MIIPIYPGVKLSVSLMGRNLEREVQAVLEKAAPDIEVSLQMININYGHGREAYCIVGTGLICDNI